MKTQKEKADALRALHRGPEILILPNAWDCASARIFEEAGFPAIATTSAGTAFSLGYPDGQRIPLSEMLAVVQRISACVSIPVTADLEGGYDDVAKTAVGLIEAGAVGLNLEDMEAGRAEAPVEIETQVRKIETVRRVGEEFGVQPVINARTDLYLAQLGDPATRFQRACERLKAYIGAGADCVFIPGITEAGLIRRFVEALKFPLNVLVGVGTPPIEQLKKLGVARVSVGSGIARAAMGLARQIATELKGKGTYDSMFRGAIPFAEANALFKK